MSAVTARRTNRPLGGNGGSPRRGGGPADRRASARVGQVGGCDGDAGVEHLLDVPPRAEAFADGEGDARGPGDVPGAPDVLAGSWDERLLGEEGEVRLQARQDTASHVNGQLAVEVHRAAERVADGFTNGGDPVDDSLHCRGRVDGIPPRRGVRPDRDEAPVSAGERPLHDVPRAVAADPAVHLGPVADVTSQQPPHRDAWRLALDIPRAWSMPTAVFDRAVPTAVETILGEDLPLLLDAQRVPPGQVVGDLFHGNRHRVRTPFTTGSLQPVSPSSVSLLGRIIAGDQVCAQGRDLRFGSFLTDQPPATTSEAPVGPEGAARRILVHDDGVGPDPGPARIRPDPADRASRSAAEVSETVFRARRIQKPPRPARPDQRSDDREVPSST